MVNYIVLEKVKGVVHIALNRPQEGNILTSSLARELRQACQELAGDRDVKAIVLSGKDSVFCTGGEGEEAALAVEAVAHLEPPVIAAIVGPALGLGLALALACDLRLASPQATFGIPNPTPPWAGLTQRLPRVIGHIQALEILLLGGAISAQEALRIGLVNRVIDDPLSLALEWATNFSQKAPIALKYVKEALYKGLDLTLKQGLRLEADLYFLLHTTQDRTEGVRAFLEKRPPQFKGE